MLLAPFDKEQQAFLKTIDKVCEMQAQEIRKAVVAKVVNGAETPPDPETAGWMNIIAAYGILFNRAVEAGWIEEDIIKCD